MLALTIGVLLAIALAAVLFAIVAEHDLADRRTTTIDRTTPALTAALALETALVNQETGVRGYVLSGDARFLEPYETGRAAERRVLADLDATIASDPRFADALAAVRVAEDRWTTGFVDPALARTRAGAPVTGAEQERGRALFDRLRTTAGDLSSELEAERARSREFLLSAARRLRAAQVVAAVTIALAALVAALLLRRLVVRPLARLGGEARRVAGGDFGTPLPVMDGPREVYEVGADVETMRARIARELARAEEARALLEAQAAELTRSNSDLEQFAYVASHDLQEPLRKIASFCQVLERRYRGQLDERADQYIDFIVDGAKRMQELINDLLAFSRVGRRVAERERLDAGELVEQACRNLASALDDAGAQVLHDGLPVVEGERPLLVAVFQNLIGNAVKFHGEEPVVVRITAREDGDDWEFACTDNGIGIDPEFAERVFVIFQRLHARDAYEGTGIGLALCRKIVEYHGGRIWVDTGYRGGTRIRFTLPRDKETA